jgi:hypothetical protein
VKRLLVLVCLAFTACGESRRVDIADCPARIVFNGEKRYAWDVRGTLPPVGHRVKARNPGCGKTTPAHDVEVSTLRGVAPEVALVSGSSLYLSPAYFTQVRSHPLHDALYGSPREPDEARGRPCRRIAGAQGRLEDVLRRWRLDFRTRIDAPLWHGVPQPRPGQTVRVQGVLCGRTRKVARLITVTSG